MDSGADRWAERAKISGTDKECYMKHYWTHLKDLRDAPLTILEIGVFRGASLALWKELFPRAQIHALDINPSCLAYAEPPRTTVTIGSQASPADLDRWLAGVRQPIDMIIDDGSHVMEHMKASFAHLFPRLRPGGLYVMEDMGTCYDPHYGGELRNPGTIMEVLKSQVDNLQADSGLENRLEIDHMHFYSNCCFIYKKHFGASRAETRGHLDRVAIEDGVLAIEGWVTPIGDARLDTLRVECTGGFLPTESVFVSRGLPSPDVAASDPGLEAATDCRFRIEIPLDESQESWVRSSLVTVTPLVGDREGLPLSGRPRAVRTAELAGV